LNKASDIDRADYDYHYRKDMEAEKGEYNHRIDRLERRIHEIDRKQQKIIERLEFMEEQFGRLL